MKETIAAKEAHTNFEQIKKIYCRTVSGNYSILDFYKILQKK